MEDSRDVLRRLEKLENSDERMNQSLQQLVISTTKLNEAVQQLAKIEPAVRELERKQINNTMVVNAVKWATVTFIGSALSVLTGILIRSGII
jgi:Tfp pilus assembly protein PilO